MATTTVPATTCPGVGSGLSTQEIVNNAFNVVIALIGLGTLIFSILGRRNAVAAHKGIRVTRDELGRVHNLVLTMVRWRVVFP